MAKYGINGFGRIGRNVLRAMTQSDVERIVAINDLTDTLTLAHLLKWDSVHGKFDGEIGHDAENIIVRGCEMKDGHGGVTIGSEISGGVRNVFAENCKMDSPSLDHALRVKNNASRGGLLENFYFRNIEVGQVAHALITIDFNYEEGAKGAFTPVMRNFSVDKLTSGKSKFGVDIQGLDNAPIYDLSVTNSSFDNVASGNIVKNLKGVKLANFKINGKTVDSL